MDDSAKRLATNLRVAREHQDVTLEAIAAALQRDEEWIRSVEAGKETPTATEVVMLARFLGMKTSDLVLGRVRGRDASSFFRATQPGAPEEYADLVELIASRAGTIRNLQEVQGLIDGVDIPKSPPLDQPRTWTQAQDEGRKTASSVRGFFSLGDEPYADLHKLVRSRGVLVLDADLPRGVSGVTLNLDEALQAIVIATGDRGDRQRFTLAHELGHLVMDVDRPVIVSQTASRFSLRTSRGRPYREVRADAFAAELLAPRTSIEAFAQRHGKAPREFHHIDVSGAAMEFQVSYGCMAYQFYLLGWVDEAGYADLRSKSGQANGWREAKGGFRLPSAHIMPLQQAGQALLERALTEGYVTRRKSLEYALELGLTEEFVSAVENQSPGDRW